jgi:hypothetical protein
MKYRYKIVNSSLMEDLADHNCDIGKMKQTFRTHEIVAYHHINMEPYEEIAKFLDMGYRWIRTEDMAAILELEIPD